LKRRQAIEPVIGHLKSDGLLKFGYPAHKIKWYRGGMQNWSNLGLTTAKPTS
jgi:hypothetical protein